MANEIRISVDDLQVGDRVDGPQYAVADGQTFEQVEAALLALCDTGWDATNENDPEKINVSMYEARVVDLILTPTESYPRTMDKVLHPPESMKVKNVMVLFEGMGYTRIDNNQDV